MYKKCVHVRAGRRVFLVSFSQCRTAGHSVGCLSRRGESHQRHAQGEGVFPKGTKPLRGCRDFLFECEPSPATTEVGLRSPFWNPLRLVQCLTLPASIFAKTNLAQKTALDSRSFAILWRESKGNRARFLLGGSRVGFQKGRGKRNPRPFCDSLHTFCSHRKYAHGVTRSETLRKIY